VVRMVTLGVTLVIALMQVLTLAWDLGLLLGRLLLGSLVGCRRYALPNVASRQTTSRGGACRFLRRLGLRGLQDIHACARLQLAHNQRLEPHVLFTHTHTTNTH